MSVLVPCGRIRARLGPDAWRAHRRSGHWRVRLLFRSARLRLFKTSACSIQPRRAWSTPNRMKSRSLVRCASVEMARLTPSSFASLQWTCERSSRSGCPGHYHPNIDLQAGTQAERAFRRSSSGDPGHFIEGYAMVHAAHVLAQVTRMSRSRRFPSCGESCLRSRHLRYLPES